MKEMLLRLTRWYRRRVKAAGQRGFVMVAAALLLSGLLAVGTVAVQQTRHSASQATRAYQETRAFYAAEGGSAVAQDWLMTLLTTNTTPTQRVLNGVVVPNLPGYNLVEYRITRESAVTAQPIPTGPYRGIPVDIQPYRIVSHVENNTSTVDAAVELTINQQFLQMLQFGIYYEEDLEIFPNFPLDYRGRIHTNGDLYLGSRNTLDIIGSVTAAGHIYRIPKDGTRSYNGKARLQDASGQWRDLRYDSRDPDWVTRSLDDWDGLVMDSAHGITDLPFPIPAPATSIEIIKRGLFLGDEGDNDDDDGEDGDGGGDEGNDGGEDDDGGFEGEGEGGEDDDDGDGGDNDADALRAQRFWYRAGLRIVDGGAYDSEGNVLTIPAGLITLRTLYDWREQRVMTLYDFDMNVLRNSAILPENRIIYISYAGPGKAVRLVNGGTLPAGGLAIATDNPLYIQGHYNNVSAKPSLILCDAFNVLSTNWNDGNSSKNLNQRGARATTVKTCVVAGNTTTTAGHYNGGAENLIRLHEKWVGHQLTYRGSLVCIYESERATGDFRNASYEEAQRDWAFDPTLLDGALWPREMLATTSVTPGRWTSH